MLFVPLPPRAPRLCYVTNATTGICSSTCDCLKIKQACEFAAKKRLKLKRVLKRASKLKASKPKASKPKAPRRCANPACNKVPEDTKPQWRRGPGGVNTLCNACGVFWARNEWKLPTGRKVPKEPKEIMPEENGDGDDEQAGGDNQAEQLRLLEGLKCRLSEMPGGVFSCAICDEPFGDNAQACIDHLTGLHHVRPDGLAEHFVLTL